jgi:hypothetical protein
LREWSSTADLDGDCVSNSKQFDASTRTMTRRSVSIPHLIDRGDPLAEVVARKIIEIGATDIRDPAEDRRQPLRIR